MDAFFSDFTALSDVTHGFSQLSLHNIVGACGVAIYISCYASLQLGLLRGQSFLYPALTGLAACCVLFSLVPNFNAASAAIQVAWIAISITGILRLYYFQTRARFTCDERVLLAKKLGKLDRRDARRFLDLGSWKTGAPGTVLTEEGEPVPAFIYLAQGAANVTVDGEAVTWIPAESYVGEITCLNREPATATVTLTRESRYFSVDTESLRRFIARNPSACHALESSFAAELGQKLTKRHGLEEQPAT